MTNKKVYVAGALTHAENLFEIKIFYEAIGVVCSELGLNPYIPHHATDPLLHPDFLPEEVYKKDRAEVLSSGLLIAYVEEPSLGVGLELAFAAEADIPIIMIYKNVAEVSRFARGAPTKVAEIIYSTELDALAQLHEVLTELCHVQHVTRLKHYTTEVLLPFISRAWNNMRCTLQDIKLRLFGNLLPRFSR